MLVMTTRSCGRCRRGPAADMRIHSARDRMPDTKEIRDLPVKEQQSRRSLTMWACKAFERELERGLMPDWLDRFTHNEKLDRPSRG